MDTNMVNYKMIGQRIKEVLVDTVKGLSPDLFVMIGLYSGLRREEILALQWDSVFLDAVTPYISVQRAWRSEHNRPVVSTVLKTAAAKVRRFLIRSSRVSGSM